MSSFLASYRVLVYENKEELLLDFADSESFHSLFGNYRLNIFNNGGAGNHNVDCCEQKTDSYCPILSQELKGYQLACALL